MYLTVPLNPTSTISELIEVGEKSYEAKYTNPQISIHEHRLYKISHIKVMRHARGGEGNCCPGCPLVGFTTVTHIHNNSPPDALIMLPAHFSSPSKRLSPANRHEICGPWKFQHALGQKCSQHALTDWSWYHRSRCKQMFKPVSPSTVHFLLSKLLGYID